MLVSPQLSPIETQRRSPRSDAGPMSRAEYQSATTPAAGGRIGSSDVNGWQKPQGPE